VARGKPAIEHLTNALNHPNLNVRLGVISALGRIGDPSAMETLMVVIRTKKSHERAYAVSAPGNIDHPDILEQIILYFHDPDVCVRESAVHILEERGTAQALPPLEIIAQTDKALVDRFGPSIGELADKAIKKTRKRAGRS
jgi:HEAT repeat protein